MPGITDRFWLFPKREKEMFPLFQLHRTVQWNWLWNDTCADNEIQVLCILQLRIHSKIIYMYFVCYLVPETHVPCKISLSYFGSLWWWKVMNSQSSWINSADKHNTGFTVFVQWSKSSSTNTRYCLPSGLGRHSLVCLVSHHVQIIYAIN